MTDGMRGLEWVRLDTAWPRNPKVLQLVASRGWKQLVIYTASLCYAAEHGTDGWIPSAALTFIHGTAADAQRLVDVGLWRTLPDIDGWEIKDYLEHQPSSAEVAQRRRTASEKARSAAEKRWRKPGDV